MNPISVSSGNELQLWLLTGESHCVRALIEAFKWLILRNLQSHSHPHTLTEKSKRDKVASIQLWKCTAGGKMTATRAVREFDSDRDEGGLQFLPLSSVCLCVCVCVKLMGCTFAL